MCLALLITNAQTTPVTTKMTMRDKRLAKIAAEHKTWDRCFIITDKADTIFGRLKPGNPKETLGKTYNPLMDNVIFFTFSNDSECNFYPFAIKQLYVYDAPEGWKKYMTEQLLDQFIIPSKAFCLTHVVEEGKCQLVSYEKYVAVGSSAKLVLFYYVIYNGQTWPIPGYNSPLVHAFAPAFRKQCMDIFAECPALVERIANKEFYYEDMPEIAKLFNNCFGKRTAAPPSPH